MESRQHVIAYLSRVLPVISETFVVREMAALRRLGAQIKGFSLHPPDPTVIHPELPHLAREMEVLRRPQNPLFWLAHLYFGLFRPARYWGCLWRYVLAAPESGRARLRYLVYFGVAPFAAWRCRQAGVRHIHAHFANAPSTVALMAAHLAGLSFSFTAHAYDIFIDGQLLPAKLEKAAFVACISDYNVRFLREHYRAATRANLKVVRNGIDLARFSPRGKEASCPPLVIAVGRLYETKGFRMLVEACARLRDADVAARCVIVGEGPEAPLLTRMIHEANLNGRVRLLGRLQPEELLAYYRQADLLAMPACERDRDRDGIPTVLIEALALEIPVVATRVSGIPELVRHEETGLLVDPDDPAALAAAMARLLRDPEYARSLSRAGRELVAAQFNLENSARQLLGLFAQAMVAGPAPGER